MPEIVTWENIKLALAELVKYFKAVFEYFGYEA